MHIYHIFFIYSAVNGCLGCFHILAVVNNFLMNIGVHVSFLNSVFVFCRYIFLGLLLLKKLLLFTFLELRQNFNLTECIVSWKSLLVLYIRKYSIENKQSRCGPQSCGSASQLAAAIIPGSGSAHVQPVTINYY